MKNYFLDHCQDAFGFMGEILSENFIQPPREVRLNGVHFKYLLFKSRDDDDTLSGLCLLSGFTL